MQRLTASLLLLPLAVLLLPSSSSARGTDDDGWPRPKLMWREQLLLPSRGALDASSLQVARAAQTAVHYFNYVQGSPSSLRALGHVKKASVKTIPGVGRKYFLQFSTKDTQTGQHLGVCLATVFYLKKKPKPHVEVNCTRNEDTDQRLQGDFSLYLSIRDDNQPSLVHLWALASIGSSYIAWEKSTEDFGYSMSQIKNVKQWRGPNDALEFDYTVLLGSDVSESLSCHMRIIWQLDKPLKVKYDCSAEEESSEFTDGSGTESGSASGFFIEPGSNF